MKEAHRLEKKITDDTMTYVQSDEGKKDCKELFPNDTQQNICRTAALFLDHYVKWTGDGMRSKYKDLTKKLKHSKSEKNYGHYVKKAAESLKNQADMVDRVLPQAQLPTSNNDLAAAAAAENAAPADADAVPFTFTPKRGAAPSGEEVTKQPDTLNQATTDSALVAKLANVSLSNNELIHNQQIQIGQNDKRLVLLENNAANQQKINQKTEGRLCNLEETKIDHEARIGSMEQQIEFLTAEKKRQARKDDVQGEEEHGGVKKGLFHDENAGNYDSDDQTGYI